MGIELAKAFVTVRADNTKLKPDLEQSRRMFSQNFRQIASSARTTAVAITSSMARITGAITLVSINAARRFAEFERTMVRVGGVTNTLDTDNFPRLEAAALKMGATTEFTANQAAQAMENLGLAGFKTDQIISALPGTLQLATAAQVDIATASDIAAKTMKAFGLEAKDLGEINDTLVSTFTRANTDIRQLAEALKPVGPVAKVMNISLADTTAILAKMADAGFTGSFGGTALRGALIRLANPSKNATKLLQAMGVQAADPLFVKLQKISDGMARTSTETAKLTIAAELFGTRGGPAMIAAMSEGIQSIQDFSAATQEAGGIAERLEKAQLNTLSGQFNILKSAIDGVFLTTGGKLEPVFRKLIKRLTEWINLNADEIALKLANAFQKIAEFAVDVFNALDEMGPTMLEVARAAMQFLKPLFDFMREHPKLMGMLLALKVTGLMGINNALGASVGLLANLLRGFSAVGPLGMAAIFAGIAVGIVKIVDAMGLLGEKAKEMAALRDQMNKMHGAGAKQVAQAREKNLQDALAIKNDKERFAALQKLIDEQEDDLRIAKQLAQAQRGQVAAAEKDMPMHVRAVQSVIDLAGFKTIKQENIDNARHRQKLQERRVGASEAELKRLQKALKDAIVESQALKFTLPGIKSLAEAIAIAADPRTVKGGPDLRRGPLKGPQRVARPAGAPAAADGGISGFLELGRNIQLALVQQEKNQLQKKIAKNSDKEVTLMESILNEIKGQRKDPQKFELQ